MGSNDSIPKKISIKTTPIAVYINEVYITNSYVKVIQAQCGAQDVRELLQEKYQWKKITINNIEWKLQANFVQRQTYSRKKTLLKWVHRLLVSVNTSYGQMIECPHCNITSNKTLTQDHFLTCEMTSERKEYRFKSILDRILQLQTPLYLWEGIMNGIKWYYNSKAKEE